MKYIIQRNPRDKAAYIQIIGETVYVVGTSAPDREFAKRVEHIKAIVRLKHWKNENERAAFRSYWKGVESEERAIEAFGAGAGITVPIGFGKAESGAIRTNTSNDSSWKAVLQERTERDSKEAPVAEISAEVNYFCQRYPKCTNQCDWCKDLPF